MTKIIGTKTVEVAVREDKRGTDRRPVWAKAGDVGSEEVTRGDVYAFPPETLLIADLDPYDGPQDARFDSLRDDRVHLPLLATLVASIDQLGVKVPVVAEIVNGRLWVKDGRQRVRAARAANVLRLARGEPPLRVRVIASNEEDAESIFLVARSLNAFGQKDGPLQIARNFRRAEERYCTTMEKYAASENISVATLRQYVALLDKGSPTLLAAVDAGQVDPTKAAQIARLPAEEQGAALESSATATVEETRRTVNRAKAEKKGTTATARFSPKEIKRVAAEVQKGNVPHMPAPARALLDVLNGAALPDDPPAWLLALVAAAGRS